MTRFQKIYHWLKPIFERLIEIQKRGGLVFDGETPLDELGIEDEDQMIFEEFDDMRVIYYGKGWTDEEAETKAYWRKKLKKWRFVVPECMQKVELK